MCNEENLAFVAVTLTGCQTELTPVDDRAETVRFPFWEYEVEPCHYRMILLAVWS